MRRMGQDKLIDNKIKAKSKLNLSKHYERVYSVKQQLSYSNYIN